MTEETKTTESEGAVEAPKATQPEANQDTKATEKSIFEGFTPEDRAYLDKKGWTEENYVSQSFKAYRNLEKMMGGSKDIIEFPKEDDNDGFNAVMRKLGMPESVEGYSYDVGEDKAKADTVNALKEIAINSHMTKKQFNEFVEAFSKKDAEITTACQEQLVEAKKQQLNKYASDKGAQFDKIKDNADRAMRMYGISEEERLGLENGIGIGRFYDLFGTIGKNLKEGDLVSSANDSITKTTESYKLELDKLFADRDFMERYMNGDINAMAKINDLNKKISGVK